MLSLFARLKRCLAPASESAIRVFPDCFATDEIVVPWDDVSRVLAHAAPRGMHIEVRAAHLDEPIVLVETQPGFDAFVRMADLRLTFPFAWWEALPRERHVVLFEAVPHEVPATVLHPSPRTVNG
jgi:hypothetical protein